MTKKYKSIKEAKFYSEISTKDLKTVFNDAYLSVYIYECYGMKDMYDLIGSGNELEKRGYTIDEIRN